MGLAPMPLSEFALIERYFRVCGAQRPDVLAGIGDDAALLAVAPDAELVAATDTLVAGVHFPNGSPPASIGHRALAVNLSDLAAMGARPAWALLALTLPRIDEQWLTGFAAGLHKLARAWCGAGLRRYDVGTVVRDGSIAWARTMPPPWPSPASQGRGSEAHVEIDRE